MSESSEVHSWGGPVSDQLLFNKDLTVREQAPWSESWWPT